MMNILSLIVVFMFVVIAYWLGTSECDDEFELQKAELKLRIRELEKEVEKLEREKEIEKRE